MTGPKYNTPTKRNEPRFTSIVRVSIMSGSMYSMGVRKVTSQVYPV
jgi:hypothetical protein